jgi:4-hydroxy-3-methylbut-2-enyl diphosphate reductase
VIFSAHGVPKAVPAEAEARRMVFVDATCPLVSKVHVEAERHHVAGLQMVMIGHAGHPETIGTMGQLPPGEVLLVETPADVAGLAPRDPDRLAFITQTTLSVDDAAEVVAALRARFPAIVGPHKEDICYATTNRQEAVKAMAPHVDALLVIGAPNSSNSMRLVEVGRRAGCAYAQLVQRAADIDWRALHGVRAVGVTAGASAPEELVREVVDAFRARYAVTEELVETARERVEFKVPASCASPWRDAPAHSGRRAGPRRADPLRLRRPDDLRRARHAADLRLLPLRPLRRRPHPRGLRRRDPRLHGRLPLGLRLRPSAAAPPCPSSSPAPCPPFSPSSPSARHPRSAAFGSPSASWRSR